MERLGGQTVTVIHRADDNDDNWTETGRTVVPGCSVQPDPTTEDTRNRQQSAQRFKVFGPPSLVAARGVDQLEVPGWVTGAAGATAVLDMDGPASTWPDENGAPHHVECSATLVEG